jgi:hypothetical protein
MKTRESLSSKGLAVVLVALGASALSAFAGCAQIVGISDLDGGTEGSSGGGTGGSGSSSGSSGSGSGGSPSGGVSAFVGAWAVAATETFSCSASPVSGTSAQQIVAGPGANQISLAFFTGCNITFTVSQASAQLDPNQTCTGESTTTGNAIFDQFAAGSATLESSTKIVASLTVNETDEATNVPCTVTYSDTLSR